MKGEEEELPTAHYVNHLKELHARQEKAMVQCESCMESKATAEAFCQHATSSSVRDAWSLTP